MKFEPDKKLHSREHVLAQDLSEILGESKKFAAYLGIARRYHERDLRALARMVKEKSDLPLEARGKYFFACLRSLPPTSEFLARLRAAKRARLKKKIHKHAKSKHLANRTRTPSRAPAKSA
ncbi:MAG: hypothetical protein AAB972_02530 [Patescibacteria group bacterium]